MRAFSNTTGKRVGNKSLMEVPVESTINRPMHHPIADGGLVNNPWFGVGDFEFVIRAVAVGVVE